jgi:hypothetical protein
MASFVAGNPTPRHKDGAPREKVDFLKDKLGQDIRVGSYIAYGHALGRCASIKIGRVLKLTSKPLDPLTYSSSPHRLSVVGVEDDLSHYDIKKYPLTLSKLGTLMYPDRIVVLDPLKVPIEYKVLLDAFQWPDKSKKRTRARSPKAAHTAIT